MKRRFFVCRIIIVLTVSWFSPVALAQGDESGAGERTFTEDQVRVMLERMAEERDEARSELAILRERVAGLEARIAELQEQLAADPSGDAEGTAERAAELEAREARLEEAAAALRERAAALEDREAEIGSREEALTDATAALDQREQELAARQEEVSAREAALAEGAAAEDDGEAREEIARLLVEQGLLEPDQAAGDARILDAMRALDARLQEREDSIEALRQTRIEQANTLLDLRRALSQREVRIDELEAKVAALETELAEVGGTVSPVTLGDEDPLRQTLFRRGVERCRGSADAVYVPAGTFDASGTPLAPFFDSFDRSSVRVTAPFCLEVSEVRRPRFLDLAGDLMEAEAGTPDALVDDFLAGADDLAGADETAVPMGRVSYDDAANFVGRVARELGRTAFLPSVDQWLAALVVSASRAELDLSYERLFDSLQDELGEWTSSACNGDRRLVAGVTTEREREGEGASCREGFLSSDAIGLRVGFAPAEEE
jgi:polyhydroxyalkanoate synthesis regulator phasin